MYVIPGFSAYLLTDDFKKVVTVDGEIEVKIEANKVELTNDAGVPKTVSMGFLKEMAEPVEGEAAPPAAKEPAPKKKTPAKKAPAAKEPAPDPEAEKAEADKEAAKADAPEAEAEKTEHEEAAETPPAPMNGQIGAPVKHEFTEAETIQLYTIQVELLKKFTDARVKAEAIQVDIKIISGKISNGYETR